MRKHLMEEISFIENLIDLDQKALERVILRLALAKNQRAMIDEAILESEATIGIVESRMKIKEEKKESLEKKLNETMIKSTKLFSKKLFSNNIKS